MAEHYSTFRAPAQTALVTNNPNDSSKPHGEENYAAAVCQRDRSGDMIPSDASPRIVSVAAAGMRWVRGGWRSGYVMFGAIKDRVEPALQKANELLANLGIVCLVGLTALITANILMRYFLNAPISWADEYSTYLLLGIIFFGLAYALQDGAHIKIDFVTVMLPVRVQRILLVAVHIVGVFFAGLLVLGACSRVRSFWELNTQSMGEYEFPLYLPALVLIAGCGMFLLVMGVRLLQSIGDMLGSD